MEIQCKKITSLTNELINEYKFIELFLGFSNSLVFTFQQSCSWWCGGGSEGRRKGSSLVTKPKTKVQEHLYKLPIFDIYIYRKTKICGSHRCLCSTIT